MRAPRENIDTPTAKVTFMWIPFCVTVFLGCSIAYVWSRRASSAVKSVSPQVRRYRDRALVTGGNALIKEWSVDSQLRAIASRDRLLTYVRDEMPDNAHWLLCALEDDTEDAEMQHVRFFVPGNLTLNDMRWLSWKIQRIVDAYCED